MRLSRSWPMMAFFLCVVITLADMRPAKATVLHIDPTAQQTPEWCWAAASTMVLVHYHFPNLNQVGNYQCGVVGAQGGPCVVNCGLCLGAGGTTQRIAAVIRTYAVVAAQMTGFTNPDFNPQTAGILSPDEIIESIDDDAPILAGITPNGIPFPPGLGFSQHAVVIVGYEGDASRLDVIINDPFPYQMGFPPPYLQAGGQMVRPGQYRLPYLTFVQVFRYGNSITFN